MAHVALAHHATLSVILRNSVRTIPHAILTTDALSALCRTTPVTGSLRVRLHWTSDQARWLQAVIAAHRQVMTLRIWVMPALHFANPPPIDCGGIAILFVTSHYAAFATDTLRHIEVKAILFVEAPKGVPGSTARAQTRFCTSERDVVESKALSINGSSSRYTYPVSATKARFCRTKDRHHAHKATVELSESTWESAPLGAY